ncbi:MAG: SPASM domain-containing protein, partial [Promethearchaeota archaeon]
FQIAPQIRETLRVFKQVKNRAKQGSIKVDIPPLFADPKNRECPFAIRDALFITIEGDIVPCYNLARPHTLHINDHERLEIPKILGNIHTMPDSISASLATPEYRSLAAMLKNISRAVPWCGDCIYSTQNCFYVKDNSGDCYGNQLGCNECLYSNGFVKCLFD